jgi:hypothetical protein
MIQRSRSGADEVEACTGRGPGVGALDDVGTHASAAQGDRQRQPGDAAANDENPACSGHVWRLAEATHVVSLVRCAMIAMIWYGVSMAWHDEISTASRPTGGAAAVCRSIDVCVIRARDRTSHLDLLRRSTRHELSR